jgi:hypothetical protein
MAHSSRTLTSRTGDFGNRRRTPILFNQSIPIGVRVAFSGEKKPLRPASRSGAQWTVGCYSAPSTRESIERVHSRDVSKYTVYTINNSLNPEFDPLENDFERDQFEAGKAHNPDP